MAAFLFMTEPGSYSYGDLVRDKRSVRNAVPNALTLVFGRLGAEMKACFVLELDARRERIA